MIDSETFGFIVTDIARLTRGLLEKRIATAGFAVTPGEARALLHIAALEGERQNRIAERLGVEPMTACTYIDRLEKLGLVERSPDPDDRRAKNVRTTAQSRELIDSILEQTAALREETLAGLEAEERSAMLAALRHARKNLYALTSLEAQETAAK
ncbi:MAG: MarR family winged helix-turn-helix transcriptional regulator [Oricola sp.]